MIIMKSDINELKSVISTNFPEVKIRDFSLLEKGKFYYACLVNQNIVFKIPTGVETEWMNNPEREIEALNFLRGKMSIPIPEILAHKVLENGHHIIGQTFLHGEKYSEKLHNSLPLDAQADIMRQMGRVIREVHDKGDATYPNARKDTWDGHVKLFQDQWNEKAKAVFSKAEIGVIEKIAATFEKLSADFPARLVRVHYDTHYGNWMFDSATRKIVGLFDFGGTKFAEPSSDMRMYYGGNAENLLKGYGDNGDAYLPQRQIFQSLSNWMGAVLNPEEWRGITDKDGMDIIKTICESYTVNFL